MKTIKYMMAAGCLSLAANAVAQNTNGGYFLDDYTYRYTMNPAMGNSRGFVSFPGLGNYNMGFKGNTGVSDLFYVVDGKTTTFLNPKVPASEVMSNIGDKMRFGGDMNINILSGGFKAFNGYNTITLSARTSMGINLPGSIISLLKEGIANSTYDIGNIDAYAQGYAQLALNHSHKITDEWRVGATAKVLVGMANLNLNMRKAQLELGENSWDIVADGEASVNMKGFYYEMDTNDQGKEYVNGADVDSDNIGLGGLGFAVDLGVVYTPFFLPDFEFSAAVLDLGGINWSTNHVASTNGEKRFSTDKYTFNVDDDAPNNFDDELDKVKDDLSALYELENLGDQGSTFKMLGTTFNIGAKYTLPMYRKVAFGLLNTTRIQSEFGWTDFRLSANYTPCKVFDMSVSADAGTFGFGWGCMLNLHCPGFNLLFGADRVPGKLAKQGVPLNSNMAFNLGINFLI